MNKGLKQMVRFIACVLLLAGFSFQVSGCLRNGKTVPAGTELAGDLTAITLPPPQTEIGCTIMQAMKNRASSRSFSPEMLPDQVMSNLLWAAFGINRPESGMRTAPSPVNWQETDIYVVLEQGAYLYDAGKHALIPVYKGDLRAETGVRIQPFVGKAPVNLVYIVDESRIGLSGRMIGEEDRKLFTALTSGFIGQNVYLYCASEGLATVVRGLINREALMEKLRLKPEQRIILAQTVGYPKKKIIRKLALENVSDGVYPGSYFWQGEEYAVDVSVEVAVQDHKISEINVLSGLETGEGVDAGSLVRQVIEQQTLDVDAISGATVTSDALLKAIAGALEQQR